MGSLRSSLRTLLDARGVEQLVSLPLTYGGGRRFESCPHYKNISRFTKFPSNDCYIINVRKITQKVINLNKVLPYGVTVTHQVLVLVLGVRIPLGQHNLIFHLFTIIKIRSGLVEMGPCANVYE